MSEATNKPIDVLCVGILVYDVMGKPIDEIPEWGRLSLFDQVEHHVGGCAANTGIDLAVMGARTAICGCVGRDGGGMFIRNTLERKGLDVSGLVEADGVATSYTFIMIGSDGQRRYIHHVGANARFTDSDVPDSLIAQARLLHMGGSFLMPAMDGEPTARVLRRARALGVTTAMDTAFNPRVDCRALVEPCLPHLDIFIPSIEEAQAIAGLTDPVAILDFFAGYRIPILGIKLGSEGCILCAEGRTHRLPVFKVTPVDSSGAGDAFMAGFLYGILKGWDVERSARMANATAAFCIQSIGCSAGVRPAEEIERFMEEHGASRG